ncbi:hypothetical protein NA56DRAFT_696951 [Hyaloscypha hepaticicola]|uniref:Uncharacterized protein n=1 Tax=Hyaloscypha hepaticicola TaxID=2082293 RepID=A0A2J6QNU0_9HELO|nr:hypothetical protein NA56DRAFT_696951 [Hyaloscypha hepaticicola]
MSDPYSERCWTSESRCEAQATVLGGTEDPLKHPKPTTNGIPSSTKGVFLVSQAFLIAITGETSENQAARHLKQHLKEHASKDLANSQRTKPSGCVFRPHKDLFYPIERLIKVLPKLEIPTKELSQIRFFHLLFGLDNDSAKKEKSFLSPTRSKFTMDLTRPLFSASGNPLCRSSNISSHFEPSNAILCHSRWDVAFRRYSNTLLKPLAPLLT